MNTSEVQSAIDSISSNLAEKVKVRSVNLTIEALSSPRLTISYNPKFSADWNDNCYESFYGDIMTILADAAAWVQAQPTRAETERNAYLTRLADAIEYGRKIGIDDALVNPLVEAMKRLSENIITKQE